MYNSSSFLSPTSERVWVVTRTPYPTPPTKIVSEFFSIIGFPIKYEIIVAAVSHEKRCALTRSQSHPSYHPGSFHDRSEIANEAFVLLLLYPLCQSPSPLV